MKRIYHTAKKKDEELLLIGFFLIGAFGVIISFSYGYQPSLFPRATAGFVAVGSLLLLFKDYLPEPFYTIVSKDDPLIGGNQLDDKVDVANIYSQKTHHTDDHIKLAGGFLAYILVGRLVGLLIATPLFVFMYSYWNGHPKKAILTLTVIGTIIPYVFMIYINLPAMDGIIWGN